MKFKTVSYSAGPVDFNKEFWKDFQKGSLNISIGTQLRYTLTSEIVGFQIDLTVSSENTNILRMGFLIGIEAEGWTDFVNSGIDLDKERMQLVPLCTLALQNAVGAIAAQTALPGKSGFILDVDDIESLVQNLSLRLENKA